ncbi:MAG: hypothetical protein ACD_50C00344G0004 [uncultured bacterium]|nr:MAG: hypothetical protein ACD_50C00344G0004 [uncultured bacterium]OGH13250.1 MAG: hypothetical protein A2687_03860 [Candidatus Levybacteria bacterium RIFCSPHIGHO2_01_FULL_38_26]
MPERLRNSPETVASNMNPVNDKMNRLLDKYLPKRKPLSLEDYDWDAMNSELTNPDLLKCLRFVAEVESNPQAPAKNLLKAADENGATWKRRFVEDGWLHEESMHGVLLRECAIRSGTPQELIDEEIEQVRAREFTIGENYSSLKADVYGWMQEATTWRFYQAMLNEAKDPVLRQVLIDIAKQENFHRHVYFEGAKTTLEHNPDAAKEVVDTVAEFIMPGQIMAPDLQQEAPRWAKKFNFSTRQLMREQASGLIELIGHEGLGESAIAYGVNNAPWYIKGPLAPLKKLDNARVYHLFGKLADSAVGKKK